MKYLHLFEKFKIKKKKLKVHTLSGVALIIENRILLVQAKKYKGMNNKWSIPKGHIEGDSLQSALKELEEETGIHLNNEYDDLLDIEYRKGGADKIMDVFVYYKKKDEFSKYLNGWEINPEFYDINEISNAKFFKAESALKKIDLGMTDIINAIFNPKKQNKL